MDLVLYVDQGGDCPIITSNYLPSFDEPHHSGI